MISCIATRLLSRRQDTGHRAIVVAILACLTGLLASANVALAQRWSLTFEGHVYEHDVRGQVVPAAGIGVWLDGSNNERSPGIRLGEVTTDPDGRFRIRITRSFAFYNLGLELPARADVGASGGEWQPAKRALRLFAMGRNRIDDIEFVIDRRNPPPDLRRIPRPDLAVIDVRHEAAAAPRREIVFHVTIENQGPGPAGRTGVRLALAGGDPHVGPLEPLDSGATGTVILRRAVPAAHRGDELHYSIAVDPNNTLAEMNEDNNRWDGVVALPRPDLTIPKADVEQVELRELILYAVVENAGNGDAGGATLSIHERNGRLHPVQHRLVGLRPGASQEIESVVTVPSQSIGQPLQFIFEIDANSTIVESNEHNNFAYAGPIVVRAPIEPPPPERRMPDLKKVYFAIAGIVLAAAALLWAKRPPVPRPLRLVPVSRPGKQRIDCAIDAPQPAIRIEPVSDAGEQSVEQLEPIEFREVNS